MWSQRRRSYRRSGEMWSHGSAGAAADGRMWSHIALPVYGRTLAGRPKPGPGANGERTVFGAGSRPMRTRFSSRRPPSSKSRPQSKAFPLAGQYAPTRWISGSTVSSRPSANPVDVKVATRTGEIMRSWRGGLLLHRFHDVLLCRDGAGPSIRMTLSLAFLCPALARTAIDGRPPRGFGVKRLMDLPMAWSDQWSALGLKDLAQATFSSAIRIHNSA